MDDIHRLIDRYFSGETDEAQEARLRDMLLSGKYEGEDVDEALAVMGYWAVKREALARPRRRYAPWAAAACVAVILSVGAWMAFGTHGDTPAGSVAYVNGVEYTGDKADDLMRYQLGLLSAASDEMEETINDDLSAFSDIME